MARRRISVLVVLTWQPMLMSELGAPDRARAVAQTTEQRAGLLASRRARHLALGLAQPEDVGGGVSIAHTGVLGVCAAALGPVSAELAGVGVDAEPPRRANPSAARFFLDEREQALLTSTPPNTRSAEHVRLWTTKEAMFKADPANAGHVLRDYHVRTPRSHTGSGWRGPGVGDGADLGFGYINRTVAGVQLTVALALNRSSVKASSRRNVSAPPVTFEAVTERISAILSVPVERLTPDSTLADLAADSFLLVEMVVDLQEEFDAIFTQADLRQITKLSDLVDVLRTHAGGGAEPTAEQGQRLQD